MNFDFSKFATLTANTVEDAFSAKPSEVIADIAKEIKAEETKTETREQLTAAKIKEQAEAIEAQNEEIVMLNDTLLEVLMG